MTDTYGKVETLIFFPSKFCLEKKMFKKQVEKNSIIVDFNNQKKNTQTHKFSSSKNGQKY